MFSTIEIRQGNSLIWGRMESVEDFKVLRTLSMEAVSCLFRKDGRGLATTSMPTVMKTAKKEAMRKNCMVYQVRRATEKEKFLLVEG